MLEHLDWYQEKFKLSKGGKKKEEEGKKKGRKNEKEKEKEESKQAECRESGISEFLG